MKEAKLTLRMLEFLEKAIEKFSYIQIHQVSKVLDKFMTNYDISNTSALKSMFLELSNLSEE
jgi:hypothetical protein